MVAEGADLLDVGGESTRPGHAPVDDGRGAGAGSSRSSAPSARRCRRCRSASTRQARASPRRPSTPGRDLLNDVWGVGEDDALAAARRRARRADRR